jgi:hypothetical protein
MKPTIAVDLAKSVFEIAVSRHPGRVAERHRLSRSGLLLLPGPLSAGVLERQHPATRSHQQARRQLPADAPHPWRQVLPARRQEADHQASPRYLGSRSRAAPRPQPSRRRPRQQDGQDRLDRLEARSRLSPRARSRLVMHLPATAARDTTMAHRSDRGGETPITTLAYTGPLQRLAPRPLIPSWPGDETLQRRAVDTTAVRPFAVRALSS